MKTYTQHSAQITKFAKLDISISKLHATLYKDIPFEHFSAMYDATKNKDGIPNTSNLSKMLVGYYVATTIQVKAAKKTTKETVSA